MSPNYKPKELQEGKHEHEKSSEEANKTTQSNDRNLSNENSSKSDENSISSDIKTEDANLQTKVIIKIESGAENKVISQAIENNVDDSVSETNRAKEVNELGKLDLPLSKETSEENEQLSLVSCKIFK